MDRNLVAGEVVVNEEPSSIDQPCFLNLYSVKPGKAFYKMRGAGYVRVVPTQSDVRTTAPLAGDTNVRFPAQQESSPRASQSVRSGLNIVISSLARADPHGQTKKQHFVSQVEQRLNAVNPAARPANQRIYEFEIVNRELHRVRLVSPNGRLISGSLSMFDLFSFDVADDGLRTNFEQAFGICEGRISDLTAKLLQAHATRSNTVGQELFDLFVAKMVNFIRNPFSVAKVLNTFGVVGQHLPTDRQTYAQYERILTGRRPQQAFLCAKLGISDEQYGAWLRVLFMLLTPLVH